MRLRPLVTLVLTATAATSLSSWPAGLPAQVDTDSGALPPVGSIIERVIARAKAQDEAKAELAYVSRITTQVETLNGDGEVTKTEHWLHERYAVEGQLFEELIEENGEPLDAEARREQAKEREEFAREARERAENGDGPIETNDERQIRLDQELMARFEASVVGVTAIDDEPHYVVTFQPRPGKLPEKTRLDRALNRSSGRLYVAQKDFGVRRIEFETMRSVRFFLGLARLRHAQGSLDFERVAPDVWLPKRYEFGIDLRVLFSNRRQLVEREWIERRPRSPTPARHGRGGSDGTAHILTTAHR